MLSDRKKCEAAGADDYLIKPIELNQFYRVLNKYLTEDLKKTKVDTTQESQKNMQDSPEYKAIVNRFLDELPLIIDEINTALIEKNWDKLQAKSHDLKGMGGAMGFPEVTEAAMHVNSLVKQQNFNQLNTACEELNNLCRHILDKNNT